MESQKYLDMVFNLEELVKMYQALHELIVHEKTLLITADIENLEQNNLQKDSMLLKIRDLNTKREALALSLAQECGAKEDRLLSIAEKYKGEQSEKLRSLHTRLSTLITSVVEDNHENERYVNSDL